MTDRPHVVVIHRWRDHYAEYAHYIDHDSHAVSYITTATGEPAVPPGAADLAIVEATDHLPAVADQVKRLAERHGPPTAIVALKEDDLMVAARLRVEWDCPGPTPAQLLPFQDKLVMARAIAEAEVPAPAFAPAPDAAAVREFAHRHGWPVIVKPRIGSSSAGVSKWDDPADCARLDFDTDVPLMVQAFDSRQIYHVDGYFNGALVGPFKASRYVNTCLGFRAGDVLGSVEEDDPQINAAVEKFAGRALSALASGPVVFHLEVFVDPATGSCGFLEVGARVGGAEIPFLWREVHGYDLMETAWRLALGRRPGDVGPGPRAGAGEVAGWLLVPAPAQRPCRISEVTPMVGRTPGPYAEALLKPGEILPAADAYYEHVGGRFRFRGASSAEVEAAIRATARDFRVR